MPPAAAAPPCGAREPRCAAIQLDRHLDSANLLDYLTLAPFGGNLEGVRAAAVSYFEKEEGS